jgi:8-oxo-dGTP diphosphatase
MPTPTKIAVVVILESPGYWLMLKRSRSPNQGLYTPVGGKIENGESPRAAAIREVQEEAGLQIADPGYCGLLVDSSPTDYNWICFVYRASVDYFEPPSCNEGMLSWIPVESLATLPTPVTDPYLYPRVLSGQPFFLNALYSNEGDLIKLTEEISDTRLFPE